MCSLVLTTGVPMDDWRWDAEHRVYVNVETGEEITFTQQIERRNALAAAHASYLDDVFALLVASSVTVWGWEAEVGRIASALIGAQYLLGIGGYDAFVATEGAAAQLTGVHAALMGDVRAFAMSVAAGELTEGQATSFQKQLLNGTVGAFDRGRAKTFRIGDLPAWPADGSTECGRNCKCWWSFHEVAEGVDCFWHLAPGAAHCNGCMANANSYSPYFVPRVRESDLG